MESQGKINKELVDAMFSHMGLRRFKGKEDNAGPLVPLLLMDAQDCLFREKILPLEFNGMSEGDRMWLLYYRDKWREAYNDFNRSLFRAWNVVQRDYVCDMMNAIEEYINNDLVILKVSAMNKMSHIPLEMQDVVATCVVCGVLIKYAQYMWGVVFKSAGNGREKNRNIDYVDEFMKKFEDKYYSTCKTAVNINFNDDPSFSTSVDMIATRIIKWLKSYV